MLFRSVAVQCAEDVHDVQKVASVLCAAPQLVQRLCERVRARDRFCVVAKQFVTDVLRGATTRRRNAALCQLHAALSQQMPSIPVVDRSLRSLACMHATVVMMRTQSLCSFAVVGNAFCHSARHMLAVASYLGASLASLLAFGLGARLVLVQQTEHGGALILGEGLGELVDCRRHLQALVQHIALALDLHVTRPLQELGQVTVGLDGTTDAHRARARWAKGIALDLGGLP